MSAKSTDHLLFIHNNLGNSKSKTDQCSKIVMGFANIDRNIIPGGTR